MKFIYLIIIALTLPLTAQKAVPLFDGKTLKGRNTNKGEEKYWSVRDGLIVGGDMKKKVPFNTFLATDKSYQNFELEFDIRLVKGSGFINSGIQVRSIRVPKKNEMKGYQVDAGIGWWGKIYDESRRNKVIAQPIDPAAIKKIAKDWDWNHYRILCEGPRIRSWINGVPALDYTEKDKNIPLDGLIGFQAHGGGIFEVQYKDITIKEIPSTPNIRTWKALQAPAKVSPPKKSGARSPQLELQGFKLPKGFTAELVASEEQGVGKPITVQWDTAGRMWTMTAFEYPIDANENKAHAEAIYKRGGKDKILVFDNPSAPGPQTPRVFADGLVIPLGMTPTADGALVQYGTEIRHYYDKNQDGKAEGFDTVLKGFGIQDSHLFPHQFERAPGGWYYLAQGLFNYSDVVRPGGKAFADGSKSVSFRQCKLARFRPDGSEFESVSAGPNNIWGLIQKNNGETFIQEANDQGIPVVEHLQGTHYTTGSKEKLRSYAPQTPATLPGQQMGGTGLSGIALTEEKASAFNQLHPKAENVFYIVNPITNRIQIITTVRDKNGDHSYTKQTDFMTSQDKWFRPVAAHFGPDGCLYIVDWYNKVISHNEVPRAHPDRDKTSGRIWRIRPDNHTPKTPLDLTKANPAQLIQALQNPNEKIARLAWYAIADRKAEKTPALTENLLKLVNDTSAPISSRTLAFWSLEDLGEWQKHSSELAKLASDQSPFMRFEVIRSLANLHLNEKEFLSIASAFPTDENYRVRAELANTIRYHRAPTPGIIALAAQLGQTPLKGKSLTAYHRNFELYLARWSMEKHGAVTAKMLDSEIVQNLKPEAFLLAVQSLPPAQASSQLIKSIPKLDRELSKNELFLLASQIQNPDVTKALQSLLRDSKHQLRILKKMELLDAKIAANPSLAAIVGEACAEQFKNQSSDEIQSLIIRLSAKFHLKQMEQPVTKWLLLDGRSNTEIISGLTALSEMRSASQATLKLYTKFFNHAHAPIKRQATISIASFGDPSTVEFFAKNWDDLPSDLRQITIGGLTSSKAKAELLGKSTASGQFKGLTTDSLGNIISVLGSDNASVKTILKNTPGLIVPVIKFTGKPNDAVNYPIALKGPFTVEAWVKLDPGIGPDDSILANDKGGADLNFFDSKFRFYGGKSYADCITANRAMQPNLWTHCAVTRDKKGEFKIYLDGELDSAKSNPVTADFLNLTIGNSTHPGGSGLEMLEFRVWDHARSPEQVLADHLTAYEGDKPKGLVHHVTGSTPKLESKLKGSTKIAYVSNAPKLITPEAAKNAHAKFQKFLKLANDKVIGDPAKGKLLFATCAACHKVGESGGIIGPDLSGAGAMTTEALLHNILTPNAKMESGYYRHDLILKNGDKVSGSMVEKNKNTISIQPIGGSIKVVNKKDIDKHNISKSSLMPEGLIDHLKPKQVSNLFSYLRTLK
ncbi:MAG: putative membrane-bound dehydrogenase-like protein [Rubritalea sp.]|jgi:putative membrane-bound dehydrogenase-like protein